MSDKELCYGIIGVLLAALLGSPWMMYWMKERDRRKREQKKRRRQGPK